MPSPARIVSLLSSATEILFGIGAGDRVVAISHECDHPPAALDRVRVTRCLIDAAASSEAIDVEVRERAAAGQPLYELAAERIAALQPELIVTQSQCDVCAIDHNEVLNLVARDPRLQGTGVLALNPTSLDDVLEDIRRLGLAAGCTEGAERFLAELEMRIAAVRARTGKLTPSERPRVLCVEWIEPLMVAANWTPDLIQRSGGDPGLAVAGGHSGYASWDDFRRYDPQVIVIAPCGWDLARTMPEAARLQQYPGWTELAAVREQRVFVVDGNAYLNRSGPRLVDSLELLAHLLQPGLFPEPPPWSTPATYGRLPPPGTVEAGPRER